MLADISEKWIVCFYRRKLSIPDRFFDAMINPGDNLSFNFRVNGGRYPVHSLPNLRLLRHHPEPVLFFWREVWILECRIEQVFLKCKGFIGNDAFPDQIPRYLPA